MADEIWGSKVQRLQDFTTLKFWGMLRCPMQVPSGKDNRTLWGTRAMSPAHKIPCPPPPRLYELRQSTEFMRSLHLL